ncbi:CobW family GTP-binding protein [Sediminispirochaeta smaragdinae]|uniref:Cobalamin synthesis protein P47K n=1 Tax=Sediminispirochaeta smaragdinae (strain DSM 11293 / JCM 15392 / SEBR 4228) TaxID=573413 RepID=E1R8U6_SEDSS|nr:CobW family GTP-binding protein [Sediminispirochaeta smaragdinae]ADK81853.1 cobalamin synthesis protein P47K [Sediminispirochaeta smaragdinae DSM 11293]
MTSNTSKLLLITGFLGSGKTTLLNRLLSLLEAKKVGVIVNEWGAMNIDASLIETKGEDQIVELSGGQIFCSCLSGSFVESVVAMAARGPDYILTEASGLAKPSVLSSIIAEATKRAEGRLIYDGTICIIDAERFLTLRQAVRAIDEQVVYADRYLINKCDLVDEARITEIKEVVASLGPGKPMYTVTEAKINAEILTGDAQSFTMKPNVRYKGWGACGRPSSCVLRTTSPVDPEKLHAFLIEAKRFAFRLKGYLPLAPEGLLHLVDCSDSQISIRPATFGTGGKREEGLVVIGKKLAPPNQEVITGWKQQVGTDIYIEE